MHNDANCEFTPNFFEESIFRSTLTNLGIPAATPSIRLMQQFYVIQVGRAAELFCWVVISLVPGTVIGG